MTRKNKACAKKAVEVRETVRQGVVCGGLSQAVGRSLLAISLPVAAALAVAPSSALAQQEGQISGDQVYYCTNDVSEIGPNFTWRSDLNIACGWVYRDPCAGVSAPSLTIPTALEVRAGQSAVLNFATSADNGMISPTPGKGSATMDFAGRKVTYTAGSLASGTDSFGVFVSNGCVPATRTITVTLLPSAPTVAPVSVPNANFNAPTSIALAVGGLWTNATIVQGAAHGSVSLSGSTATYTPVTDYYGTDSFTYSATDGTQTAGPATVSITVPKPAAPVATDASVGTAYMTTKSVAVAISGAWSTMVVSNPPANGTATVSGNTVAYTPAANFSGQDFLDVRVTGVGGVGTARIFFNVGAPVAPIAPELAAETLANTSVDIPVESTGGPYEGLAMVSLPAHGGVSITLGKLIYRPADDFVGTDTFIYRMTGKGGQSQNRVTVTVKAPAKPIVSPLTVSTEVNTAITVQLPNAGGVAVGSAILNPPGHGTATMTTTELVYTPANGFVGQDTLEYWLANPGGSSSAVLTINVNPPPAPTAEPGSVTTTFGAAKTIPLGATGNYSGFTIVSGPAHGTVGLDGSSAIYNPEPGYYGPDSFTYAATGLGGTSAPATVTIMVERPAAPTVSDLAVEVPYETRTPVYLGIQGVASNYEIVAAPAHGSLTSTPIPRYTPAAGFYGADMFTFRAVGPGGTSETATVRLNVARPPAPSVSGASATTAFGTAKSITLAASGVVESFAVSGEPQHGTVRVEGSTATYTPADGYFGVDAFTFTATGPGGTSSPATVNLIVELPPAPVAHSVSVTTAYLVPKSIVLAPVGVVTAIEVEQPAHGKVDLVGSTATYMPDDMFWGEDSFSYRVTGPGGSSTATVSLTVALPPAPVAKAGSLSTPYGVAVSGQLRATGVYDQFEIVTRPQHGEVALSGADVTYTPDPTFYGQDAFTYTARGPGGVSAQQSMTVEVGLPGAPSATPVTHSVGYNGSTSVKLSGQGVYDSFAIATPALHGTASLDGDTLTYIPTPGYFGEDTVMFTVTGPGGTSAPVAVTLEVAKPSAPTAAAVNASTAFKTAAEIQLAAGGVFDTIEILQPPKHGNVAVAGSTATYTPGSDYYGPDAFTYVAKGPGGVSAVAEVKVSVGLPPAPTVQGVTLSTAFGESVSRKLSGAGVLTRYVVTKQPANGVASIDGDVLVYKPNGDFYGSEEFAYAAEGPGGLSQPATVTVAVGLPGSPALNGDELTVQPGQPATLRLRPIGVVDGYEVMMIPTSGSVSIVGDDLTYTPVAGFSGRDSFAVRAYGPGGKSEPATFAVMVQAAAVPEIKVSAPEIVVAPDAAGTTQIVPQGAVDDIVIVEQPKNGKVEVVRISASPASALMLLAEIPETLAATYTPNKGFQGRDNFVLAAKGPGGMSKPVRITVKVGAVPPPIMPEGTADEAETLSGRPVRIEVLANDRNATRARLLSSASHGTVVSDGGAFIYTPQAGYNGPDEFTYRAVNDDGESDQTAVKIMVVNGDLPSVVSHTVTAWAGKSVSVDLTEGATGGPFLGGRIESVSNGRAGVFGLRTEGDKVQLVFTPYGAFAGKVTVRYVLTSRFGDSQPGEVILTVKERPDPAMTGDMSGLVTAAGEAAARFSQTQSLNAFRRMESLHDGAIPRASLGLGLPIDNGERAPGRDPSREAMRAELEAATAPERKPDEASPYGRIEAPHVGLWAGGAFDLGHRNASQTISRRKFETSGLTVGLDRRLTDGLAAGLAVGFGRDRSEIGSAGSRLSVKQVSGLGYATMQFAEHGFFDLVGGYGRLDYKTLRRVEEIGKTVEGQQDGSAIFTAMSLGWAIERRAVGFSPYARVQYLRADLKAYSETGDDTFALKVGGRKVEDLSVVAGSRMWVERAWRAGVFRPEIRFEYRQTVKGAGGASLQYADWLDGPVYQVKARAFDSHSADLGVAASWRSNGGPTAEVEYQTDLLADGQAGRISLRVSTAF